MLYGKSYKTYAYPYLQSADRLFPITGFIGSSQFNISTKCSLHMSIQSFLSSISAQFVSFTPTVRPLLSLVKNLNTFSCGIQSSPYSFHSRQHLPVPLVLSGTPLYPSVFSTTLHLVSVRFCQSFHSPALLDFLLFSNLSLSFPYSDIPDLLCFLCSLWCPLRLLPRRFYRYKISFLFL